MRYNLEKVYNYLDIEFTDISNFDTSFIDSLNIIPQSWSKHRKIIGYLQHIIVNVKKFKESLIIDGYYGELTDYAFNSLLEYEATHKIISWRKDYKNDRSIKTKWPNYNKLESFYGKLETIPSQLVTIPLPYTHKLAWNPSIKVNETTCHKLVADSYTSILEEVLSIYGKKDIEKLRLDMYGGCYNNRKMRGGNKPSTHAFGIAFDYDPEYNQLRWDKNKASFAQPDYIEWLNAWNKQDAINLGEIRDYDWQHFQFSRP